MLTKRHLAYVPAPLVAFSFFLWGFYGHPSPDLDIIATIWCLIIAAFGFLCLLAAPIIPRLASLGATLCQGLGLLGTVVGFMLMLAAHGVENLEEAGIYTALSTTVVGLAFALLLYTQSFLLEEDS